MASQDAETPRSDTRDSITRTPGARVEDRAPIYAAFLTEYGRCGVVTKSAIAAGVGRATIYQWMDADPEFAAAFAEARAIADDAIREELRRRAMEGYERPVYQGGVAVGTVTERSDQLLALLAKSRMREFREKAELEVTGEVTLSLGALRAIRSRVVEGELAGPASRAALGAGSEEGGDPSLGAPG